MNKTVTGKEKYSTKVVLVVLKHVTNVVVNESEGTLEIWDVGGKCVTLDISTLSCGSVEVLFSAIDDVV